MAPAGDSLAEPITVAGLRAEVLDEKRASISAEKRASIVTDPRPATADAGAVAPAGGVIPDGQFPTAEELGTLRRVPNKIPMKLISSPKALPQVLTLISLVLSGWSSAPRPESPPSTSSGNTLCPFSVPMLLTSTGVVIKPSAGHSELTLSAT
ncbi:hypothetical protein LB503_003024 [Fusarium chuoi]|nr:hypothetical protein LB503_003024 [Fusarium chuoi]